MLRNLKSVKCLDYGTKNSFKTNPPLKEEGPLPDPKKSKVLLPNTPREKDREVKPLYDSLSDLKDPPVTTDGEGLMEYTKKIVHYVINLDATLPGFTYDIEGLGHFIIEKLDWMSIRIEATNGYLGQYDLMKQDYGIVPHASVDNTKKTVEDVIEKLNKHDHFMIPPIVFD